MTYERQLQEAIRHFWKTREDQASRQGTASGERDTGARSAVTGGRQMDGFVVFVRDLMIEAGLSNASIHCERNLELPGYFRAEKKWDLVVVVDDTLLASIEFKSQIGPSFGNNYNNRTEEAIGSATDLWLAYRDGALKQSSRPWVGYLMLLEETARSMSPVAVREPHFPVFEEFRAASYAKRYEILLTKLIRERLYDASCLLLSDREGGLTGSYREASSELGIGPFVASLLGRAIAFAKTRA